MTFFNLSICIKLLSSHIYITTALELLKYLQAVIQTTRENVDAYEQKGATKTTSPVSPVSHEGRRKKLKMRHISADFTNREAFRVIMLIPITDNLM